MVPSRRLEQQPPDRGRPATEAAAGEPDPGPGARRSRPGRAAKPARERSKRARKQAEPWITARELTSRGVPHHRIQSWLNRGELEHSGERGIYVRGPQTERMITEYLAGARGRRRSGAGKKATTRNRLRSGTAVSAQELLAQGITRAAIRYWLDHGVLERGGKRGTYLATRVTASRIAEFLARGG
jgi:hypothetical protein